MVMKRNKGRLFKLFWVGLVFGLLCGGMYQVSSTPPKAMADSLTTLAPGTPTPTAGPNRKTTIKVSYITYEWWLINWSDNQVVCQVYVEHEGWPSRAEVYYYCGQTILNVWTATPTCNVSANAASLASCSGLYLYLAHVTPGERKISVNLAPPAVWVSITGCTPTPPQNTCDTLPQLLFTGEEPLPNEQIIRIQGSLNGEPFSCAGNTCTVPMPPTGKNGIPVVFWADSSFGDFSQHFTAQVRAVPWGDFTAPDGNTADKPLWYVDVLSTQWRGAPLASCAETWASFPDLSGPPAWLLTPDRPEGLKSSASYYYLAGALIKQGAVDASDCPNGGLQDQDVANACGLQKAQPSVDEWQNRFDAEIIKVAQDTGIPAQLIKNVFSRESQFWPGLFKSYQEVGLGQLTSNGADTVLLWNPNFFSQFCPLIYSNKVCQQGFGNLTADQQSALRGALVSKVNAACPDCVAGIDLSQANFSIGIFARSLLANCEQVGELIYNTTQKVAGSVSNYSDLWKFTLVNYNAGPGCLGDAIQTTVNQRQPLDWASVSPHLGVACQGAIKYVNDISQVAGVPTPTPTSVVPTVILPTQGPTQPGSTTATATAASIVGGQKTPTPAVTPTPTPTLGGYPAPGNATPTLAPTTSGYPAPTYNTPTTPAGYP